jgi:DNA polymerase-1
MIMQVHDELVFEAPVADREALMSLVREEMEGVLKLRVPLRVEIAGGKLGRGARLRGVSLRFRCIY